MGSVPAAMGRALVYDICSRVGAVWPGVPCLVCFARWAQLSVPSSGLVSALSGVGILRVQRRVGACVQCDALVYLYFVLGHHFGCSGLRFGRFNCLYSHRIARFSLWVMQCALSFPRSLAVFLVTWPFLLCLRWHPGVASWWIKGCRSQWRMLSLNSDMTREELFRSAFVDQAAPSRAGWPSCAPSSAMLSGPPWTRRIGPRAL